MEPKPRRYTQTGLLALHQAAWGLEVEPSPRGGALFLEEPGVAVLPIRGPLLQHADPWGFFDSYDAICARAAAAFASPLATVLACIDSPGGDAAGCMELGREMRAMADKSGKLFVTHVDGMMASAALAIGAGAHVITAPPTSSVGSIGVFDAILDLTKQDAMRGVNVRFVASGPRKLDQNPHVAVTDEAEEAVRARVMVLAGLFFEHVSALRGMPAATVEGFGGALYIAPQALERGLVDRLMTYKGLLEVLASNPNEVRAMAIQAKGKGSKEIYAKLAEMAGGDDEDDKKMAKKMLATLAAEEEPDGDEPKKKEEEEAKAKAAEEEKKKDEEAKAKAKTEEDAASAKALAANSLALAEKVQAQAAELEQLKARDVQRDAAAAKATDELEREKLLGKRPDFSPEQHATLACVPLEKVREAVEKWPRTAAAAGSSAAALTAGGGVSGGERRPAYQPRLSAEEQAILDKTSGDTRSVPLAASSAGTLQQMPRRIPTREEAKARLDELDKLEKETA